MDEALPPVVGGNRIRVVVNDPTALNFAGLRSMANMICSIDSANIQAIMIGILHHTNRVVIKKVVCEVWEYIKLYKIWHTIIIIIIIVVSICGSILFQLSSTCVFEGHVGQFGIAVDNIS